MASAPERPLPDGFLTLEGQQRFLDTFLPVRNRVLREFYHGPRTRDRAPRTAAPAWRAAIRLLGTRTDETVPELYRLYYNRLFAAIWLALNWGPYTPAIRQLPDPLQRIHLSQVNSVDTCWRPAVESAPPDGLLVEVGTGLSDGWARLALLMPQARIVTITIERDQAEIGRRIARELGLHDRVRFRVGDVFSPGTTQDLAGQADAVTAMGVIPHFPPPRKAEGLRAMAAMLKPGSPLLVFDAYRTRPFSPFMRRALISSLSWYPSGADFRTALDEAGLRPLRFDIHPPAHCLPFADDTRATAALREEFGPLIAWTFPRIVSGFMKGLLKPQESVYLSAVRK
ncbi:class I SAM-dependent methyltransferase [Streptomyces sp. NRRL S-350]|uniref:class I SAM-dependent methyltransferase n=1 Tax=Streptomyces sp. NRRL S-350 TaxID=1463902 RepID=UPI0004BF6983|nr:class I SAM-dependent methyltransferase [Streptomyces sp. NRRL S-350]